MKQITEHYLPIALMAGFFGSALWVLFVVFIAAPGGDEGVAAAALGMVVWFVSPFMMVVFVSGLLAGRQDVAEGESMEINLLMMPHQRERLGFILMAAALTGLAALAAGAEGEVFVAAGSMVMMGGGAILVGYSMKAQKPERSRRHL